MRRRLLLRMGECRRWRRYRLRYRQWLWRRPRSSVEAIDLAAVLDEGNGLGGFAQRDGEDAGRKRIERAGMAGLLGVVEPADLADSLGRATCPAGLSRMIQPETARLFRFGHCRSSGGSVRPSASRGDSVSRSLVFVIVRMQVALHAVGFQQGIDLAESSKVSSTKKRSSGANLRSSSGAMRPRMKRWWRLSASTISGARSPPSGMT